MRGKLNDCIAVLIPSYDRPEILRITLRSWLEAESVDKIFVVAQGSSEDVVKRYEEVLRDHIESDRVVYRLAHKRLGSIKARNYLLEMAFKHNCRYIVMADDDYLLPSKNSLVIMASRLDLDSKCGAIGGKVIIGKRRREDPDFFLNLPMNLADLMSKITGYVFLDVEHGPRYSEFLPHFFMIRKEILSNVRYDEAFDTPTSFREESDFQLQIKNLGYRLCYDPGVYVIHLAIEKGGNRPKISMKERMYWKARNHTIFILKWNRSTMKRLWYIVISTLILSLYRPWYIKWILKGVKDGIQYFMIHMVHRGRVGKVSGL